MPAPALYLHLPGTAAEALEFYQGVFGGETSTATYAEFGRTDGPGSAVAHGTLTGGLFTVSGGDAIGGPGDELPPLGSDVYSFLIGLEDVESAKSLFARIAEGGGKVAMPFELAPWGDHYGQVVDRFGVMFALVVGGSSTQS